MTQDAGSSPAGGPGGLRLGTAERAAAVHALDVHRAAGRIDASEFEDREVRIRAARYWADLEPLFADLPEPRPRPTGDGAAVVAQPAQGHTVRGAGSPPPWMTGDHDDAWFGRLGAAATAVSPFVALVLFFVTKSWLAFLLIPAVGAVVYGSGSGRDRNRDRRDRRG